jgi:hypothetical protein
LTVDIYIDVVDDIDIGNRPDVGSDSDFQRGLEIGAWSDIEGELKNKNILNIKSYWEINHLTVVWSSVEREPMGLFCCRSKSVHRALLRGDFKSHITHSSLKTGPVDRR